LLCYQEFFYQEYGFDSNFDPEFAEARGWESQAKLHMKNAYLHLTLDQADWNVSPTHFQASSFPEHYRRRFSVIHDGVDVHRALPKSSPAPLKLPDGTVLESGQPIVTFVNRKLEPYRGCHTFLRSIPELQKRCPEARIVIVGGTTGVSYGAVCPEGNGKIGFWRRLRGNTTHRVSISRAVALRAIHSAAAAQCLPRVSHLSLCDELEPVGGDGLWLCCRRLRYGSSA
jgi:glycosyltransferase involved in cell wall biosynthesis